MTTDKNVSSRCAFCTGQGCYPLVGANDPLPPLEKAPEFCPMRRLPDEIAAAEAVYQEKNTLEFARLASVQEAECYEMTDEGLKTTLPRIEETIRFAKKCGYTRLGIAFCIGLRDEAQQVALIFKAKGFDVISVCCKVGRIPKESLGISPQEKIVSPDVFEPACNPVGQAYIMNAEKVDLAIQLGLCVGHDTLFMQHCKVPGTVLAVKDRVLGHNPLAAVYLSRGPYYSRLKTPSA